MKVKMVDPVGKQAKWGVIPMTDAVENTLIFIKFFHPLRNWSYESTGNIRQF